MSSPMDRPGGRADAADSRRLGIGPQLRSGIDDKGFDRRRSCCAGCAACAIALRCARFASPSVHAQRGCGLIGAAPLRPVARSLRTSASRADTSAAACVCSLVCSLRANIAASRTQKPTVEAGRSVIARRAVSTVKQVHGCLRASPLFCEPSTLAWPSPGAVLGLLQYSSSLRAKVAASNVGLRAGCLPARLPRCSANARGSVSAPLRGCPRTWRSPRVELLQPEKLFQRLSIPVSRCPEARGQIRIEHPRSLPGREVSDDRR